MRSVFWCQIESSKEGLGLCIPECFGSGTPCLSTVLRSFIPLIDGAEAVAKAETPSPIFMYLPSPVFLCSSESGTLTTGGSGCFPHHFNLSILASGVHMCTHHQPGMEVPPCSRIDMRIFGLLWLFNWNLLPLHLGSAGIGLTLDFCRISKTLLDSLALTSSTRRLVVNGMGKGSYSKSQKGLNPSANACVGSWNSRLLRT
jgi:hypothetical protein